MGKTTGFLFLFVLLLVNSDFLKANTQEDCFDRAELITIAKYLDFRNAVASSGEEARQPDAGLMREASQAERDAPMLGLSQEEAIRYGDWVENGDDKYHLISNNDGSFSLVENKNETNSPLMMFGWGKKPAGDNRLHQAPTGNNGEIDRSRVGANDGDNQERAVSAAGQPMPPEKQANNQPAVQKSPTVDDFIDAASKHFNDSQLLVCRDNGTVLAVGPWDHNWISELRNSRRKDTKIALKEALEKVYEGVSLKGLPLIKDKLWSSPLRSLDIFQIVMEIEKRATTAWLDDSSIDSEKYDQISKRKKNFKKKAIEFAEKVAGVPEFNLSSEITEALTMMAKNLTGSTSVTALGVGVTLDNHDSLIVPATIMRYFNTREKKLAYQMAAHVCFDYNTKFLKMENKGDEESELAPRLEASVRESEVLSPLSDSLRFSPSASRKSDCEAMQSAIERASSELQSLWEQSERRYTKFRDYLDSNGKFWRTHFLENINRSVPWYSYNYGSWHPQRFLKKLEFDFVTYICDGDKIIPEHVGDVIRKTYSLRYKLHTMIMNRGLSSDTRADYMTTGDKKLKKINNAITKYEEQYAGPNAKKWKTFLDAAKQAAERANQLIKCIHDCKNEGCIF